MTLCKMVRSQVRAWSLSFYLWSSLPCWIFGQLVFWRGLRIWSQSLRSRSLCWRSFYWWDQYRRRDQRSTKKYFSGDHDLVNGRNDHLYLITDRLYRCDHANTISRPWLEWLRFWFAFCWYRYLTWDPLASCSLVLRCVCFTFWHWGLICSYFGADFSGDDLESPDPKVVRWSR